MPMGRYAKLEAARFPLTEAVQDEICEKIRGGAYPHVAAMAAGIPEAVFDEWMRNGDPTVSIKGKDHANRQKWHRVYSPFWLAVKRAAAQARLGAELQALEKDPMSWLKSGPGKDREGCPGWSRQVSATTINIGDNRTSLNILDSEMGRLLIKALMQGLEEWPEARAAAAAAIADVESAMLGKRRKKIEALPAPQPTGSPVIDEDT